MSEQQIDFKKIIYALNSQKYTPQQIGSFMRQYYVKHLKSGEVAKTESPPSIFDEAIKIFDGGLL